MTQPPPPAEPGDEMLADMTEQAPVLRALVDRSGELQAALAQLEPPSAISLVARGTSLNAAIYGRYRLEIAAQVQASIVPPSLHTRYDVGTAMDGVLAIGLSQSGATPEIVDSLESMRSRGATTVAITNVAESPLAHGADVTVHLAAGHERAVPATKTFTAQLAAIDLIASHLANEPIDAAGWEQLITSVADHLSDDTAASAAARVAGNARSVVCLGRGLLYPIALEAALKIVETSQLPSSGYSSTEFLHGPIAQAGPTGVALCFADDNDLLDDTRVVARRLVEANMPVISIGPDPSLIPDATAHIPTRDATRNLSPILHIIRAQQFARALTLGLGLDPDHPAGLAKVTATH